MNKLAVVILAAGQGKRMGGETPKVLRLLNGRPLIAHLYEAVRASGICERPTIVVCDEHNLVQEALGAVCEYVVQAEQLGTGHAVACAESFLKDKAEQVLVLYGDHPLLKPKTLRALRDTHLADGQILTLMTTVLPDFNEWRSVFFDFGRIVRNEAGKIIGIVEQRDAAPEQRQILEVNPMYCCFRADWLWTNLKKLDKQNVQGEYYLTDLIRLAFAQGEKIASLVISDMECLGVNRPEELERAEELVKES